MNRDTVIRAVMRDLAEFGWVILPRDVELVADVVSHARKMNIGTVVISPAISGWRIDLLRVPPEGLSLECQLAALGYELTITPPWVTGDGWGDEP